MDYVNVTGGNGGRKDRALPSFGGVGSLTGSPPMAAALVIGAVLVLWGLGRGFGVVIIPR